VKRNQKRWEFCSFWWPENCFQKEICCRRTCRHW